MSDQHPRAALAAHIRYDITGTWLGLALVATTERGVAAILIGDRRASLERQLAEAFPAGVLIHAPGGLDATLEKVTAFIADPAAGLDLPLDAPGSEVEQAVWAALRAVPAGELTTYGRIAKALPVAATAQEVGLACAANVLAVAVPCHRVVKADGSISGYRWGVGRKLKLIKREAA